MSTIKVNKITNVADTSITSSPIGDYVELAIPLQMPEIGSGITITATDGYGYLSTKLSGSDAKLYFKSNCCVLSFHC